MGKFYQGLSEALTLYVRQYAWLCAVPETKGKLSGEERQSRLDRFRKDGRVPDFPEVEAGIHVVEYLLEVGPVMAGAMAPAPVTHEEIMAWQANTGIELTAWEARTVRHLSMEYLSQLRKAEKTDCPPPFVAPLITDDDRETVSRKVKGVMRSFMASFKGSLRKT